MILVLPKEMPLASAESLTESLMAQLGYLNLDERQYRIAEHLIGSIDEDGYIRREIQGIINDLAFYQNIETEEKEIEKILLQREFGHTEVEKLAFERGIPSRQHQTSLGHWSPTVSTLLLDWNQMA